MKLNLSESKRKFLAVLLITVGTLIITGILSLLSPIKNLELKVLNQQFSLRGPMADRDTSIVIVNIDDQTFVSMAKEFKWPFRRSVYAKLIRNLNDPFAMAKLIVFDLEFTDPTLVDPAQDAALGLAAAEFGNVIFAGKLVTEIGPSMTLNQYALPPVEGIINPSLSDSSGSPWGYVNIIEDEDGFLRRYYFSRTLGGVRHYPLAVLAAKTLLNVPDQNIREDNNFFYLGEKVIPKASAETMLINYAGPAKTFNTYSFSNILDDDDPEFYLGDEEDTDIFELHRMMWETFKDKIVFIGASAEELQDTKFAPFFDYDGVKQKMPGVEAHANALNTILTGNYLKYFPGWAAIILITFFAFIIGLAVVRIKPVKAGILTLFVIILYVVISYYGFARFNHILPFVSPLLAISLSYFGNTAYLYATEQKEKQRYRKIFSQYVSKSVVGEMLDSGQFPSYGGERKELTVLFSDIRAFTNFSEQYPPEEVVSRLSEYLTEMTQIVYDQEGMLDKYVGDEIMAVFGAPLFYKKHAENACIAAVQMIKTLKKKQQKYAQQGETYFNIGVGINTGAMVVGNLGSQQLFDYTVIGDAVNLGARLEGVNKFYGTHIIISETAKQAAGKKIVTRELDTIQVKGKDEPIRIYELLGIGKISKKERTWLIDAYHNGLEFYSTKKWYKCIREMNQVLHYYPDDGPTKLYIRRCLEMIENPPEKDWKPVYRFDVK